MIISFHHKGIERYYLTCSKSGIQLKHAKKLRLILTLLEYAKEASDLDIPSLHLHRLMGNRKYIWSVWVNKNWRVTFKFIDDNVELVNYEDYH